MAESFPMKGGDGTDSYSKNSQLQREASDSVKGMMNEAIIQSLDIKTLISTSKTIRVADLGCSIGPNTFFAMQNVIETIETKCRLQGIDSETCEFQIFFNDHAENDFNTLFTSLPPQRKYHAAGVPGSFYHRLFPSSSIHFVHSSYATEWLSKVPDDIQDKDSCAWNKGNIHYAGAPDAVLCAYQAQFYKDMEDFLRARAIEIVPGGFLVVNMPGMPDEFHCSEHPVCILFNFLGSCLADMVNEGIINEVELDSFNLPIYAPTSKEMTGVIEKNGHFSIEKMELSSPKSSTEGPLSQTLLTHFRACMEGVFAKHFGNNIADQMFQRAFQKEAEISQCLKASRRDNVLSHVFVILKRI